MDRAIGAVAQAVCTAAVQDKAYYAGVTQAVISERTRLQGALREPVLHFPQQAALPLAAAPLSPHRHPDALPVMQSAARQLPGVSLTMAGHPHLQAGALSRCGLPMLFPAM